MEPEDNGFLVCNTECRVLSLGVQLTGKRLGVLRSLEIHRFVGRFGVGLGVHERL